MNNFGYSYLGNKEYDVAISLFEMNVDSIPSHGMYMIVSAKHILKAGKKKKRKKTISDPKN